MKNWSHFREWPPALQNRYHWCNKATAFFCKMRILWIVAKFHFSSAFFKWFLRLKVSQGCQVFLIKIITLWPDLSISWQLDPNNEKFSLTDQLLTRACRNGTANFRASSQQSNYQTLWQSAKISVDNLGDEDAKLAVFKNMIEPLKCMAILALKLPQIPGLQLA